jgi:hypothetical protein
VTNITVRGKGCERLYILLVTSAIFIATVIFMPKRITWLEIYTTAWFGVAFASLADIYFDLKLELYGFFDRGQASWEVLILYFGMYPTYNAIFLNFFPKSNRWKQALYILANDVFLFCYEWFMLQIGVLYYNTWKIWYSALAYPLILLILYWNWKITKRLFAKAKQY